PRRGRRPALLCLSVCGQQGWWKGSGAAVLAPCSRRASGTVLPARYCLHGGAARYCLHDAAVRCCGALWSLESSALVLLLWREGEGGSRWPSRCAPVSLLTAPLHAARRSGKAKPLGRLVRLG